jgi:hypothetical protein
MAAVDLSSRNEWGTNAVLRLKLIPITHNFRHQLKLIFIFLIFVGKKKALL